MKVDSSCEDLSSSITIVEPPISDEVNKQNMSYNMQYWYNFVPIFQHNLYQNSVCIHKNRLDLALVNWLWCAP